MFFFRRVISDESFILGFLLEGKGYTIESAWQSLYFSTNGWNTIQLSGMFRYFFPERFFRPVLSKKAENLIFLKQIRHSPLPSALFNFDDYRTYLQDP